MSNDSFKSPWDGVVKSRPGWAVGDGYAVGDDPFNEQKRKPEDSSDTESNRSATSRYTSRSAYSPRSTRDMDRDRYEPSQYGERGYAAADGYARDARSDYYEQSQYGGGNARAYSRDPAPAYQYEASRPRRDQRRSYDDQDMDDYYEKTRITTYRREPVEQQRSLAPYVGDRDRERARSQEVYSRRDDRDRGPRSRGRRDSSSSSSDRDSSNTPLKKWAATFAGAAVGGMAANRVGNRREGGDQNWVATGIGAVIGGLVGREVEKKVYEHKDKRHEREREREERY